MDNEKRFQDLCHQVLNLVGVLKSLAMSMERHNLDIQNIIGKMAHRCGEAEESIRQIMNKPSIKDDEQD